MTPISTRNSLSTARLSMCLLMARPAMPPPMPPATISSSTGTVNSGTLPVIRVVSRLAIWLKRMMYRLFWAAVLVSMLKKKKSTTRLMGPPRRCPGSWT